MNNLSNKESLQENNSRLNTNNTDLASILNTINDLPNSGEGTSDYNALKNKPKINNIELTDNKTLDELGIQEKGNYITEEADPTVPSHVKSITEEEIDKWNNVEALTNTEIESLLEQQV